MDAGIYHEDEKEAFMKKASCYNHSCIKSLKIKWRNDQMSPVVLFMLNLST